jgi:phosphohistidine phosphatase
MKRVVIVRHAKTVPYGYDNDFTRDLTGKGESDALKISRSMKIKNMIPDLIISSPAKRAMHTALIFCSQLGYDETKIIREQNLYSEMTAQNFVELLQNLPETAQTVFVFGHNPTAYYLVYSLVKDFNSDMPTCSTVVIDFQINTWKEVCIQGGQTVIQLTPRTI